MDESLCFPRGQWAGDRWRGGGLGGWKVSEVSRERRFSPAEIPEVWPLWKAAQTQKPANRRSPERVRATRYTDTKVRAGGQMQSVWARQREGDSELWLPLREQWQILHAGEVAARKTKTSQVEIQKYLQVQVLVANTDTPKHSIHTHTRNSIDNWLIRLSRYLLRANLPLMPKADVSTDTTTEIHLQIHLNLVAFCLFSRFCLPSSCFCLTA